MEWGLLLFCIIVFFVFSDKLIKAQWFYEPSEKIKIVARVVGLLLAIIGFVAMNKTSSALPPFKFFCLMFSGIFMIAWSLGNCIPGEISFKNLFRNKSDDR